MTNQPDNVVMIRVQQGQLDALGILYEKYKNALFSYFLHMTHDRHASQDLVQNVFLRVLKYKLQYKGDGSFKAWLFSIGRNVLADKFRKGKRFKTDEIDDTSPHLLSQDNPHDLLVVTESNRRLLQAIGQLSDDKREVVTLVKLQELKYREVAEILQINESTIKVKVFRAIRELKAIMIRDKSF